MPRFVVLLHETAPQDPRPTHWDLMLEDGDSLATWALQREPRLEQAIAAEQLSPHRLDYLVYEGPISGDRGVVTRWDSGTFAWRSRSEKETIVVLSGHKVSGRAVIRERQGKCFFRLSSSDDKKA